MKKSLVAFSLWVTARLSLPGFLAASVEYDPLIPQVAFAADEIKATLFETPPASAPCPFKLGIIVSKNLVIFQNHDRQENMILWSSE